MKLFEVVSKLYADYRQTTSSRLKIIDAYMFYILLSGVLQYVLHLVDLKCNEFFTRLVKKLSIVGFYMAQSSNTINHHLCISKWGVLVTFNVSILFIYCACIGSFPFNSFLSGFISTVGCFVLAASLRIQANPENRAIFPQISLERAYGDFIFAHVIFHLVIVNFLG